LAHTTTSGVTPVAEPDTPSHSSHSAGLKVISWNVNVRRDVAGQVAALAPFAPDVVALQEVTAARVPFFRTAFAAVGLKYLCETASACTDIAANRCRDRGVLVASRWPGSLRPIAPEYMLPWPERLLSVTLHTPWGDVELHTVYVPSIGGGNRSRDASLLTLERLYAILARTSGTPRILCGDFNLPQHETTGGEIVTFAQTRRHNGSGYSIPQVAGKQRTHAAELAIMRGLAAYDLVDVYRALHGYETTDASWYGQTTGYRLDHLFAARSLNVVSCRYLHDLRERRLSDHSPLEAVFAPAS